MIPLREAHQTTGLPLFRITASATGKGGVVIFLKGDVVWARKRGENDVWEPIGLEEPLLKRAEGK
jgi:tuftelin-interacting protein 11